MSSGIEIRRAEAGEAARLSEIARLAKGSWGYPPEWISAWEKELTISPRYVRSHSVYLALMGSEVVGFYALEWREMYWQLEHLWVEPTRQKRGIGRRLFEHALVQVRALRPGKVVIQSDPHAAEFYLRMGARQTGVVPAPVDGSPDREAPVFEVGVEGGRR